MSVPDRLLAELRTHPPAVPVPVRSLAERLQCSPDDVMRAGQALQSREPGDDQLVTVIRRIDDDGADEFYVSLSGVPLNDEPETS